VTVHDVTGRMVRELLGGRLTPGVHALSWDGRDDKGAPAGPGCYYVRLAADGVTEGSKLVIVR
jgi:flagellar hook assembly protein FlgD